MTVAATPPRFDYLGTGTLATYGFPNLKITAATDLRVTEKDVLGNETVLVYPTDFSVSGVNSYSGGSITLTAGNLTSGHALTIRWDKTPQQGTDLRNQGDFFPETHEQVFDELTRYIQALNDKQSRSLHLPETEVGTELLTGLPTVEQRKGRYLFFDPTTGAVTAIQTLTPGALVVSAFIQTFLPSANPSAAQAILDVPSNADVATLFATLPILNALIAAKGDLIVGTANDTPAIVTVGANGTIPMARSAATAGLAYVAALNKAIYGFTYANNSGDATNDLDIVAGGAMDATGAYWLTGSARTKQSDVLWAVGNGGMLDAGAVGNNDYFVWAIGRSDTGVIDYLSSVSSTGPDMTRPGASYDFKRLIGWFIRRAGTIVAFHVYETEGGGLEHLWDVPTLDVNLANTLTTARSTDAVKVPLNFSTIAHLNVGMDDAGIAMAWVGCPDHADAAPSLSAAPLANIIVNPASADKYQQMFIRTSATGAIAARADTTIDSYVVSTMGFTWARRN